MIPPRALGRQRAPEEPPSELERRLEGAPPVDILPPRPRPGTMELYQSRGMIDGTWRARLRVLYEVRRVGVGMPEVRLRLERKAGLMRDWLMGLPTGFEGTPLRAFLALIDDDVAVLGLDLEVSLRPPSLFPTSSLCCLSYQVWCSGKRRSVLTWSPLGPCMWTG